MTAALHSFFGNLFLEQQDLHCDVEIVQDNAVMPSEDLIEDQQQSKTNSNLSDNNDVNITDSVPPLRCYHDGFPIITIDDTSVCVAEYIFEHLENTTVTDLVTHPDLTLVFQNGHTLPLYIPATGQPIQVDDDDALLDSLNGLGLIDVEWEEEEKAIILYFGQPIMQEPMVK